MPIYTLTRSLPCGTQLRWLTFDRAPPSHTSPGQFVAVQVGDDQAYFAIASSPGNPLELLIKDDGDAAAALLAQPIGAQVQASDAMGKGFGAETTRPRPLVCLVNGSALAAVRPVIEAELAAGLPRPVTLLLGVLSPDRQPFSSDLARWAEQGVTVHVVVDAAVPGWSGAVGFVQSLAHDLGLVRDDVAVVVCGVPAMQAHAAELYAGAGLDPAYLLTNY